MSERSEGRDERPGAPPSEAEGRAPAGEGAHALGEPASGERRPEGRPPPARPTPVRAGLPKEEPPEAPADDPELRPIEVAGVPWTVVATGSTRSGAGSDSGAPLLHLRFARIPPGEGPAFEAVAVGTALEALDDEALARIFARARPVRPATPSSGRTRGVSE